MLHVYSNHKFQNDKLKMKICIQAIEFNAGYLQFSMKFNYKICALKWTETIRWHDVMVKRNMI